MLMRRLAAPILLCALLLAVIPVSAQEAAKPAAGGILLVLNKAENSLVFVNPQTMSITGRVPVGEGPHEVIASADGKFAYVGNYGTAQVLGNSLSVIDLAAKKELRRVDLGALRRPHGLVELNGKVYFTCEVNRVIARYDPAADKVDWVMGTGQGATHMIAGQPNQKQLYTANISSNTVTLFDLGAQPLAVVQLPVADKPEGIDLTPNGKEVWVAHRGSGQVSVIDTASRKVVETLKVGGDPYRVKFTPDGQRALITDPANGALLVLDVTTRKELKRFNIEGAPAGITVTPDSKRAFVTTIQANGIAALDLEALTVTGKLETGKGPDGLAWAGQ